MHIFSTLIPILFKSPDLHPRHRCRCRIKSCS